MWKSYAADAHTILPREELPKQLALAGSLQSGGWNLTDLGGLIRAKMMADSLPLLKSLFRERDYDFLLVKADAVDAIVVAVLDDVADEEEEVKEFGRRLEREVRRSQIPGEDSTLEEKLGTDASALDMVDYISNKRLRDAAVCNTSLDKLRDRFGGMRGTLGTASDSVVRLLKDLDSVLTQSQRGSEVYTKAQIAFDVATNMQEALPLTRHQETQVEEILTRAKKRTGRAPARSRGRGRSQKTEGKQVWIEAMRALVLSSTSTKVIETLSNFVDRPLFEALAPSSLAVAGKLDHVARLYDMAVSRAKDTRSPNLTHDRKEVAKMLRVLYVALQQLMPRRGKEVNISLITTAGKKLKVIFSTMLAIEYHTAYEYYNASEGRQTAEPTLYKPAERQRVLDDGKWTKLSDRESGSLAAMRLAVEAAYAESWDASLP